MSVPVPSCPSVRGAIQTPDDGVGVGVGVLVLVGTAVRVACVQPNLPQSARVADQRVAERCHVDAHLVSSSGFEPAFDQSGAAQGGHDSVVRDRPLAAPFARHRK